MGSRRGTSGRLATLFPACVGCLLLVLQPLFCLLAGVAGIVALDPPQWFDTGRRLATIKIPNLNYDSGGCDPYWSANSTVDYSEATNMPNDTTKLKVTGTLNLIADGIEGTITVCGDAYFYAKSNDTKEYTLQATNVKASPSLTYYNGVPTAVLVALGNSGRLNLTGDNFYLHTLPNVHPDSEDKNATTNTTDNKPYSEYVLVAKDESNATLVPIRQFNLECSCIFEASEFLFVLGEIADKYSSSGSSSSSSSDTCWLSFRGFLAATFGNANIDSPLFPPAGSPATIVAESLLSIPISLGKQVENVLHALMDGALEGLGYENKEYGVTTSSVGTTENENYMIAMIPFDVQSTLAGANETSIDDYLHELIYVFLPCFLSISEKRLVIASVSYKTSPEESYSVAARVDVALFVEAQYQKTALTRVLPLLAQFSTLQALYRPSFVADVAFEDITFLTQQTCSPAFSGACNAVALSGPDLSCLSKIRILCDMSCDVY